MVQQKHNENFWFIGLSITFFAVLQLFQSALIYQSDLFLTQPWRWWTGHWVHVGWIHYGLNVLALACLPLLFPNIQQKVLILLLLVLSPLLSLCFYLFYPQIFAYAGLSGVLHGLFIFGAIVSLQQPHERKFAVLLLLLILGKIAWEYRFGALQTEQLIGHPVLTQAHLLGVIFGSICSILTLVFHFNVLKNK
ncbi:rhombosortase [Acinetobacter bereziniae]|uniref:rhombosortase n=1 Tax=Acinetobacter bereziniae TaxID=106648 RepID=UPI0019027426|nr:rhombosortase [Acinetobacter bereziniae]MBJ8552855.1 rhombosortase [Acinetobacter bereziniae]